MSHLNTKHRNGFNKGLTQITQPGDNTGIAFSILRLERGETHYFHSKMELALLHMDGAIEVEVDGRNFENQRNSIFDESPFAVHVSPNTPIEIKATSDCECGVFETLNEASFPSVVYLATDTENEHRGKGLLEDTSMRYVRTIFDGSNSHPNTKLVLGEVVNFPGRWSSYPPHHHPQPEIYHYRFTNSKGYGHAEMGDDVYKVHQNDTLKIVDNKDHSQCAAPGYGMYYIWVIRHLEKERYTVPEFTEDHRWTMQEGAEFWRPQEEEALV